MARPKAITKLSETSHAGKKNWLVYCGSGIGKTVLAGTAPRALFLTAESAGTESAKAFGSTADEWICDTWEEYIKAYEWIKKEGYKEYDWILPDSLTEIEELCWNNQLEAGAKEFEARIQDYGIVDRRIKKMVDMFHRLPINVLWTAQEMAFTTEDGDGDEIQKVLPKIGRTKGGAPLANLICGKVTLVGYLGITEEKDEGEFRRLVVAGGDGWVAKDRHDAFGKYIDVPDIATMSAMVDARQASGAVSSTKAPTKKKKQKEKVAV